MKLKAILKKLFCILVEHDDPVMDQLTYTAADYNNQALFEAWLNTERHCRRCGKSLKPKP